MQRPSQHLFFTVYRIERLIEVPGRTRVRDDVAWITQNDRPRWHVEVDVCARGDKRVISYGNSAYQNGIDSDPNSVTNGRGTHAGTTTGGADGDSGRDVYVATQNSVRTDDDGPEVPDVQAFPNPGRRRNIKSVAKTIVIQPHPIVDVGQDAVAARNTGIIGYFSQIEGEPEPRVSKIRRRERSHATFATVAVRVGSKYLPQPHVQSPIQASFSG